MIGIIIKACVSINQVLQIKMLDFCEILYSIICKFFYQGPIKTLKSETNYKMKNKFQSLSIKLRYCINLYKLPLYLKNKYIIILDKYFEAHR